jgi:proteasome lid subunit RPN8/RPN11
MIDKIHDQILDHAAREFPREACGLIINTGYSYYGVECENRAHDPEQSFLIDPLVIHQYRNRIACVYHSHPNRSPKPSEADIASSERCAIPFLIISYPSGEIHAYTPQGVLPAPYENRAFVYGVMDCLSLAADYYRHELGIIIREGERKQWGWWHDKAHQHAFVNGFLAAGFNKVDDLQPNDLIIMALRQSFGEQASMPNHVAVYLGEHVMLHHPSNNTSSRKELYGHYWRSNTVCYLRYQ